MSRAARQVGKLGAAEVVVFVAALIQTVVVARWLGPQDYGVAALIFAYTGFVYVFLDPRSSEAVVRYISEFSAVRDLDRVRAVPALGYLADAAFGALALLIVATTAPWVDSAIVGSDGSWWLLLIFAGSLTFAAPSATSRGVLTAFDRFGAIAKLQSTTALVRLAIVLAVVMSGGGLAGFVVASAISILIEGVVMIFAAQRVVHRETGSSWFRGGVRPLAGRLREIIRFMVYTDLVGLVGGFTKQADVLILGFVRGPTDAAFYRIGLSVASPIVRIGGPLTSVFYPRFARLAARGASAELDDQVRRTVLWAAAPITGLVLLTTPLVPYVIELAFGTAYVPGARTAQVIVAASAISLGFFWLRPLLLAVGRVRPLLGFTGGTAALATVGFFLGAHWAGHLGVALARAAIVSVAGSCAIAAYLLVLRRRGRLLDEVERTTRERAAAEAAVRSVEVQGSARS
ncbi:MAG: lipopolysaccharide biosynthesis protein [Actinomycetota bacterium]|nr:lipopolysaccharide biosynthesis protein [Actinomycetota bacterium]